MINRRNFLTRTFLSSAALSLGIFSCDDSPEQPAGQSQSTAGPAGPVTIATWSSEAATQKAMGIMQQGGSALDAVEAGVGVVEADPDNITVGYGGLPDRDGRVTLDACIMDHLGNAGSVACLQHIKHPISVARKVMEETPHVMLVGDGALDFALSQGFPKEDLLTPKARQAWERWLEKAQYQPQINIERHDTIGMLTIDRHGHLAGACTTSGMAYKMAGRVGDSPIIGAGLFVDSEVGGAAATGLGEYVMKTLGSFLVVEFMRQGLSPADACRQAVERIVKKYGRDVENPYQVGFIALNRQGETGGYSIEKGFSYTLFQGEENRIVEASHLT